MEARAKLLGHSVHQMLIVFPLGLVAAVFGFANWTAIPADTRAKRVGTLHGLGNVVVVGLFFVSWLLRLHPGHDPGAVAYIFSFAGAGLALVTGWLGASS